MSPTAWRINARSLYELDGVRVEQIAPTPTGENRPNRQRGNPPFLRSYLSTYTLEANDPFQSRQHYPTPDHEPSPLPIASVRKDFGDLGLAKPQC